VSKRYATNINAFAAVGYATPGQRRRRQRKDIRHVTGKAMSGIFTVVRHAIIDCMTNRYDHLKPGQRRAS